MMHIACMRSLAKACGMREQLCMQGLGVAACFLLECCYLICIVDKHCSVGQA
jgi:hypothetical protein